MDFGDLNIVATLHIRTSLPLDQAAAVLGEALGCRFLQDAAGTMDEFPSFTARVLGLRLVLLGIPEANGLMAPEAAREYELQVIPPSDSTGEVDCNMSHYIASLLAADRRLTLTEIHR